MTTETEDQAKDQAKMQLAGVRELVAAARDAGDDMEAIDDAEQAIRESVLSVDVRSGWHAPGSDSESEEYMVLLCTGGPACRIVGTLNSDEEPASARIEYQDWGIPWTDYPLSSEEEDDVLLYCNCFYFGG